MKPPFIQGTASEYPSLQGLEKSFSILIHRFWQLISGPHPAIQEINRRRQAQLLATLTLIVLILIVIGTVSKRLDLVGIGKPLYVPSSLSLASLTAYFLSRTRYYQLGSLLLISALSSSGYWFFISGSHQIESLYTIISLALLIGSVLLTLRGLVVYLVCNLAAILIIKAQFSTISSSEFTPAIGNILTLGILFLVVTAFRNAIERGKLDELNKINQDLVNQNVSLEKHIEDRTHAIMTSAEVSRRISTILELPVLVSEVVEQLQKAFHYYHVHIYLFDETRENLVMAGGTGLAGQAMSASGHHLRRGMGLVGMAADTNSPVIVPDVRQNPIWLPNALLPETRSEAAIPISMGDNVLGILDVQQDFKDGFKQDDVSLLVAVSNQVAIAIQNASLFSEARQRAERESLIATIGQKIRTSSSVEEVLQVALRELAQNLNVKSAGVEVHTSKNLPLAGN